jgi:hypothetical protein
MILVETMSKEVPREEGKESNATKVLEHQEMSRIRLIGIR